MTVLNSLFTEEIAGTKVLVSFDYDTQKFKVANSQTGDVLIEGSDIAVNAFLEKNGARVFLPRYMANDPVTTVNANNADKTHYSAWAVLLYLKNRADGIPIEMVIYPRDYQEGSKFVPGIKIPLGECALDNMDKSSIVNLLMTEKDLLKDLKKIAIRTYTESENREVALIAGTNRYYPMSINPGDVDSFANSLILVANSSGNDIDEEKIKKALNLKNTMSVISPDEGSAASLEESLSFDDIINKHVVVFESKDLNSLSRTLFHVHPEANYHNWKVSEIKENSNHDGFLFEVFGEATDEMLSNDFILGRLLSENVYITRRTPMHESSCAEKAVFSLMHGATMDDIKKMMFKECGVSGGMGLDAGVALPIMDTGVMTTADSSLSAVTSSDIHGIQGKVLAPMLPEKKKKKLKPKHKAKHESLIEENVLNELGIYDSYKKLISLSEDEMDSFDSDFDLDMSSGDEDFGNDSADDMFTDTDSIDNSGDNLNVDSGDVNNTAPEDTEVSTESKSEDIGMVEDISEEGNLIINWEDGTTSEEKIDNLLITSTKKPEMQI